MKIQRTSLDIDRNGDVVFSCRLIPERGEAVNESALRQDILASIGRAFAAFHGLPLVPGMDYTIRPTV